MKTIHQNNGLRKWKMMDKSNYFYPTKLNFCLLFLSLNQDETQSSSSSASKMSASSSKSLNPGLISFPPSKANPMTPVVANTSSTFRALKPKPNNTGVCWDRWWMLPANSSDMDAIPASNSSI